MSSCLGTSTGRLPLVALSGSERFNSWNSSRVSIGIFNLRRNSVILLEQRLNQRISSAINDDMGPDISDVSNYIAGNEGLKKDKENQSPRETPANTTLLKLKRYGIAGVLSYGLLNTVYYLMTFLIVWFYVAPAPGKMGYAAAVARFFKILAMVWAGSQVTKLIRAGGALAMAPFVDRGIVLVYYQNKV